MSSDNPDPWFFCTYVLYLVDKFATLFFQNNLWEYKCEGQNESLQCHCVTSLAVRRSCVALTRTEARNLFSFETGMLWCIGGVRCRQQGDAKFAASLPKAQKSKDKKIRTRWENGRTEAGEASHAGRDVRKLIETHLSNTNFRKHYLQQIKLLIYMPKNLTHTEIRAYKFWKLLRQLITEQSLNTLKTKKKYIWTLLKVFFNEYTFKLVHKI